MIAGAYSLITMLTTWPAALSLDVGIIGDDMDPWQTVWGLWWWHERASHWRSPMTSELLWWPDGATLWLQTWDIPSIVMTWPLWGVLSPVTLYNVAIMASFPLSGITFYLLCRHLFDGTLAPALAGAIYTFSTYHFGHANGTLHMASMEWAPVYFLGLARLGSPGYASPVLMGAGLALSLMASPYFAVFCALGTGLLAVGYVFQVRRLTWLMVGQGSLAFLIFVAISGWLVIGMVHAYRSAPFTGEHDAFGFSLDLQSLFVPNAVSAWRESVQYYKHWNASRWHGAVGLWGNSAFVSYATVTLAIYGAQFAPAARRYLVLALTGVLLALGPVLQVGGRPLVAAPFGWLQDALPALRFSGTPSRFAWLYLFGLSIAAGAGLSRLIGRGKKGALVACLLAGCSVLEAWPRRLLRTELAASPAMERLASGSAREVVLDATGYGSALWNQMQHRHSMIGGYVTRPSTAASAKLHGDPVLMNFLHRGYHLPAPRVVHAEAIRIRLSELGIKFVVIPFESQREYSALTAALEPFDRDRALFVFRVP